MAPGTKVIGIALLICPCRLPMLVNVHAQRIAREKERCHSNKAQGISFKDRGLRGFKSVDLLIRTRAKEHIPSIKGERSWTI
ncbi:hypothetical protein KSX_93910 [Ktedonospora formicarum]|uniref:Uncharacterized protein n=1 Tax=Ktedonospora formicarum TaxID=2778364 RepID=A0A8J3IF54_9CHLR|nr:hypothetical protein KSX_93910 [Ktedonospora formicarum]